MRRWLRRCIANGSSVSDAERSATSCSTHDLHDLRCITVFLSTTIILHIPPPYPPRLITDCPATYYGHSIPIEIVQAWAVGHWRFWVWV